MYVEADFFISFSLYSSIDEVSLGRGLSHCHASFLAPFEFQFTSKREFVKLLKVSLAIKDIVIVVLTKKEKKCVKVYNRNASFDMSLFSKSTLSINCCYLEYSVVCKWF